MTAEATKLEALKLEIEIQKSRERAEIAAAKVVEKEIELVKEKTKLAKEDREANSKLAKEQAIAKLNEIELVKEEIRLVQEKAKLGEIRNKGIELQLQLEESSPHDD